MYDEVRRKREQKGREAMADDLFACLFHVWLVALNDFLLQCRAGFFKSRLSTLGIHFSSLQNFFHCYVLCSVRFSNLKLKNKQYNQKTSPKS